MMETFSYRFHRRLHRNRDGAFARLGADATGARRYFCSRPSDDHVCTARAPCAACLALLDAQTEGGRRPTALQDDYLFRTGLLGQQYLTHTFARINLQRVNRTNTPDMQDRVLRRSLYHHVREARALNPSVTGKDVGTPSVLPSTVTGSKRQMNELFMDAMALMAAKGAPSLFLTMTMNPKDADLLSSILHTTPHQKVHHSADLVARIFAELVEDLKEMVGTRHVFGECTGYTYSIEFHSEAAPAAHPHAHIILKHPPKTGVEFDAYCEAEIPAAFSDEVRELRKLVLENNIHTCDAERCLDKNGRCKKHFPFDFCSYTHMYDDSARPIIRRRSPEEGGEQEKVIRQGVSCVFTNRDVVSFNRGATRRYRNHCNVMPTTGWRSIKYVFKYVYKGPDRAMATLRLSKQQQVDHQYRMADEVQQYLEGYFYMHC